MGHVIIKYINVAEIMYMWPLTGETNPVYPTLLKYIGQLSDVSGYILSSSQYLVDMYFSNMEAHIREYTLLF